MYKDLTNKQAKHYRIQISPWLIIFVQCPAFWKGLEYNVDTYNDFNERALEHNVDTFI